jgi:hypothetical protein
MVGRVLFGLALTVMAGVIVVTNLRLKRRGHRTTGTVAGLERDWNPDPDAPGYTYWPVLEFQTDRGQDVRTRAKVSGSPQVGRRVRILYDPDNRIPRKSTPSGVVRRSCSGRSLSSAST